MSIVTDIVIITVIHTNTYTHKRQIALLEVIPVDKIDMSKIRGPNDVDDDYDVVSVGSGDDDYFDDDGGGTFGRSGGGDSDEEYGSGSGSSVGDSISQIGNNDGGDDNGSDDDGDNINKIKNKKKPKSSGSGGVGDEQSLASLSVLSIDQSLDEHEGSPRTAISALTNEIDK